MTKIATSLGGPILLPVDVYMCGMEVERVIDYSVSCPIIHPVVGREWLSTRRRFFGSRLAQN